MRAAFFVTLSVLAMGGLAACVLPGARAVPTGAQDFTSHCAGCHGVSGKGDGASADGLARRPADLTGLSARNGGTFPLTMAMNKIWGYSRGAAVSSPMPHFADLMDSPTVPVDLGDGVETPTPQRLIDLADYLATLQG